MSGGFSGTALSMHLGDITARYTVSAAGRLKSLDMAFGADAALTLPGADGTAETLAMTYDYTIHAAVNATGSAVRISFPDFSGFATLTDLEDAA